MTIHELQLDFHLHPNSLEKLTSAEVCQLCAFICDRILGHFKNVLLVPHQAEQAYAFSSNTMIQLHLEMLGKIIATKTGFEIPKVKIHSISGINVADDSHQEVASAFRTMFRMKSGATLQEISDEDPILLLQLLNIVFSSSIGHLKNHLHSPREIFIIEQCEHKLRQTCDSLYHMTNALLTRSKPFAEKRTRLYVIRIVLETT